jgi:hypothetical protein
MWVVSAEALAHARDKTKAVVVEITPRVRVEARDSSAFDKARIQT